MLMMQRAMSMSRLDTKANPCITSMGIDIKMGSAASIPQLAELLDKGDYLHSGHFDSLFLK